MTDSRRQAGPRPPEPNQDTYKNKRREARFSKLPWSAYFFYFGPKIGGTRVCDRYYYPAHHGPIRRADLRTLITQLALNARKPLDERDPYPYEQDADNIWTRKSYLIALVDDPGFKFDKKAISIVPSGTGTRSGTPNHTFFDAKNFPDIELPTSGDGKEKVPAVCVIDHMKNVDENDLEEHECEEFIFRFSPDPLAPRPPDDDGGTNLGPPAPPP